MNPYESPTHCEETTPDWYGWSLCLIGCSSLAAMVAHSAFWFYVCRPGQPELGGSVLFPYFCLPLFAFTLIFIACLKASVDRDEVSK